MLEVDLVKRRRQNQLAFRRRVRPHRYEVGTLKLAGWSGVTVAAKAPRLRPGMALTLNGIAQAYVADRVAAMVLMDRP